MNQLTSTVISLKGMEKGSFDYETLFADVFYGVQASMDAIVNSYAYSLKGDVAAAESLAMEHLMISIEKFQYQGFEFLTFYKKTLKNKMVDLVRSVNAEKVRHNTSYEVSLSVDVTDSEGYSFSVEERIKDDALRVTDTYNLEDTLSIATLLDEYTQAKPKDAALVTLSMTYSPANGYKKQDLADAIMSHYNEETYTNAMQQRLSRALKGFKKYATNRGYVFSF